MGLLTRITDRIAERAARRAFEVGIDTLNDIMKDSEKRKALLGPIWDYFDKRINLKWAHIKSGQEKFTNLPEGVEMPEMPDGGMGNLTGGLGVLTSFLPPGVAQFAPLLGMMGGGGAAAPAPAAILDGAGNGHKPGLRR